MGDHTADRPDDRNRPDQDQPDTDQGEKRSPSTGEMRAVDRRAAREPRYVYRTRIRVSTLVLVVNFVVLFFVYGITSQRYGDADNSTPATPTRTSETSTTRPTPSSTVPSSSSVESSSTVETTGTGNGAQEEDEPTTQTQRSAVVSIPGIPPVTVPVPGAQSEQSDQQTSETQQTPSR